MKHIYTITVMESQEITNPESPRRGKLDLHSPRCMGWFPNLEGAILAVEKNQGGLDECLYDYLVIERIQPGIQIFAKALQWYLWESGKPGHWTLCNPPEQGYVHKCNWGMG